MESKIIKNLQRRLEAGDVIIMDGGTGSELRRRGVDTSSVSWSAKGLLTNPETVVAVHEDYIRAGADIIITNTFGTSPALLTEDGLGDRVDDLNILAVDLARQAIRNAAPNRPVVLAGSVPAIATSFQDFYTDYHEQTRILAEAGVDVLVIEMLTRVQDVEISVDAATATGLPTWAGLSCHIVGEELFLGVRSFPKPEERVSEAAEVAVSEGASAMFIMHTSAQDTAHGLQELKDNGSVPLGAYSHNSSEHLLSPEEYLQYARGWVDMGAQIIGGCCSTTPAHIEALKSGLPTGITKA